MRKDFETEYRSWMEKHLALGTGERLRRLRMRHGFGEKCFLERVWWPVIGNLDDLFPEYELVDADGRYYYLDFAYLRLPRFTCLESDGFGPHARDADRDSFSNGLDRQNEIVLSHWNILRFSTDKLKENPLGCQKHVRRMLEEWYGEDGEDVSKLSVYQREIVRLATRSKVPITPEMVGKLIEKSDRFAREQLHQLVSKGILEHASGDKRVRSYRLRR